MLHNSKEIIFLEAIDQFFECEDSDCICDSNKNADFDFKTEKMNDRFCDSLIDDMNSTDTNTNSTSTEFDFSEDFSFQSNIFAPKKKLFISDCVNINQANINKIKKKLYNDYFALIIRMNECNL